MACLSADESLEFAAGGSSTISTSGCEGEPTVTQRIPSNPTSLRTSSASTSRWKASALSWSSTAMKPCEGLMSMRYGRAVCFASPSPIGSAFLIGRVKILAMQAGRAAPCSCRRAR